MEKNTILVPSLVSVLVPNPRTREKNMALLTHNESGCFI
jgi:hypothetical protein